MITTSRVRGSVAASELAVLCLVTGILAFPPGLVAQGARVRSQTNVLSESDKDNLDLRQRWFRRGRGAPAGESAAELRYRAHRQKLFMRAQRSQRSRAAGNAPWRSRRR
jgi:hypothetical protein